VLGSSAAARWHILMVAARRRPLRSRQGRTTDTHPLQSDPSQVLAPTSSRMEPDADPGRARPSPRRRHLNLEADAEPSQTRPRTPEPRSATLGESARPTARTGTKDGHPGGPGTSPALPRVRGRGHSRPSLTTVPLAHERQAPTRAQSSPALMVRPAKQRLCFSATPAAHEFRTGKLSAPLGVRHRRLTPALNRAGSRRS
jgi:hypothetical protein